MTRKPPLLSILSLAGFNEERARKLAEANSAEERRRRQVQFREDETRLADRMAQVARSSNLLVGKTETGEDYGIPLFDFAAFPSWITAATGVGKSRLVGGMMSQIVAAIVRGEPIALTILDGKGETADQLLRTVAGVASRLTQTQRRAFLSNLYTFRFFDREYLPSWPLLAPMAGLTTIEQADLIAEVLGENAADATVGPRQRLMLSRILALAAEFDIPLIALPWLLNNANEVTALASRSSFPSVRLDLSRFNRENQSSIDGIVARIGLLLIPSLKAVLSGSRPFNFVASHKKGSITIIDVNATGLAQASARSVGSLAISAWTSAGFSQSWSSPVTSALMVDEPQAFGNPTTFLQLERLITLGRSFGLAGVALVHQGATQLPSEFQTLLNTNIPLRILGRSAARDAEAAAEWLPRTGRILHPRQPGGRQQKESRYLSESQELHHHVAALGRLAQRHFLVADRRTDFAPRIVRAASYDPPSWSQLDPEIANAVRCGANGVQREQLEMRVREIEAEADARFQESQHAEVPRGRRRHRNLDTPDVVGHGPGFGRGQEP